MSVLTFTKLSIEAVPLEVMPVQHFTKFTSSTALIFLAFEFLSWNSTSV
jgi:hypothetical protein